MLDDAQTAALIGCALKARESAYAPYSKYHVGAAVVADDDRVFVGCNVENASYGLSLCAERNAIASAVTNGAAGIKAVVVITNGHPAALPCGACRQWLAELGGPECEVICASTEGDIRRYTAGELLPEAFRLAREQ